MRKMAERRPIDADALTMEVVSSQRNNPHANGRVKINHHNEHDHFMKMIYDAPTVDAVALPCKAGTDVWLTWWWPRGYLSEPMQRRILHFLVRRDVVIHFCDGAMPAKEIGKTIFFTREEAEREILERSSHGL